MSRNLRKARLSPTALVAAIYVRYSSDRQRDASIEDQIRLCKELIDRMGWVVGPIYIDRQISGSIVSREGFQKLRKDVRGGTFQVVVAESLDRLMRDGEASFNFGKHYRLARVQIHTHAEGPATKLIMGFKGTINAVFLDDLAEKTHRGLHGRIEDGASAGGLSYGYDVVATAEGEDKGQRCVNVAEAEVVRRIFDDYGLRNLSPKKIAAALNREGIPGPRGGKWSQSTIYGNRTRGTGIVNNELYVGVLVWNRLRYEKHPDRQKHCSQLNPEGEWLRKPVPELRIVDDALWARVKGRQTEMDGRRGGNAASESLPFWRQKRPSYLLSGLLRYGACGGGVSVISATHVGCSDARNRGASVCTNRRTMKRSVLEDTVLDALRTRLMAPEVYAAFVRGFTAEWNAAQKGRAVAQEGQRDELK
ncbi:recombinase family protein [Lichenibacterium dinghuense]|uniref:recombinase family protein n=1 Tax=Lichenibacterium dinghuense TaxID=2895977 RepID=UPI001F3F9CB9|nr:recombinase family protein [Lichenibacterium sp. 6Y81]